jgi:hypothetical protein
MNTLSVRSFITNSKSHVVAIAIMLVASLSFGLTGTASATDADVSAKSVVGEANAENSAVADPIKNCGPAPRDKDGSAWGKYFKVNGVNMRRSPSTQSQICGQGQKSHRVDYHCYTFGRDGRTWSYVRDVNTHYAGWVRDDLLKGYGSLVRC